MKTDLIQWLKKPAPLKSLYFVVGNDPFFLSEIKKTFKKQISSQLEDFNQDEVSVAETPLDDILTLFETLPLFSEKRLLLCSEADKLSEKDWIRLEPFLSSPSHTIFVCFFEKKDGRKKQFKFLKEKGMELNANSLKSWEIGSWLDFLLQKESLHFLSLSAKSLFQELTGNHLMEIQIELKKLKQYLGGKTQITEEDVLSCTSRLKIDSLFDLTEALGNKNVVKSLSLIANLLDQNQNAIAILSLVARHIRILAKIKVGQKENLSSYKLAQKAGVTSYFLKNYLKQSQLWSEKQIEKTIQALFFADKALKSSPLSAHIWLENFILKSCS
ncbi:MAG: DNA polymerase III subunit delta [Bdellovibrionaceae bacterium]|nr:DNA polymerase III subunit delta [Pseudobdellovibrionaceae bacterium]